MAYLGKAADVAAKSEQGPPSGPVYVLYGQDEVRGEAHEGWEDWAPWAGDAYDDAGEARAALLGAAASWTETHLDEMAASFGSDFAYIYVEEQSYVDGADVVPGVGDYSCGLAEWTLGPGGWARTA